MNNKDLLTSFSIPVEVEKRLRCQMLHIKRPVMTGKQIKDPVTKETGWEIIYYCKECDVTNTCP